MSALYRGPILIKLDCLTLILISRLDNSSQIMSSIVRRSARVTDITSISSAYIKTPTYLPATQRPRVDNSSFVITSFTYTLNKYGERTPPWRTPASKQSGDDNIPFHQTATYTLLYQSKVKPIRTLGMLRDISLSAKPNTLTLSDKQY